MVLNSPNGITLIVVFEKAMPKRPDDLNRDDGYVRVVRVDKPDMENETVLENMKNNRQQ